MKSNVVTIGARLAGVAVCALVLSGESAWAASYWWTGATSQSWSTITNWTNTASGASGGARPVAADDAVFSNDNYNAGSVQTVVSMAAANQAANSILFKVASNGVLINAASGTTSNAQTLAVGSGGITLAAGAGPATFGGTDQKVNVRPSASMSISNNSSSLLTFTRPMQPSATSISPTVTFSGTGSGITSLNDLTDNIVIGTGTGPMAVVINTGSATITQLDSITNSFSGGATLTRGILAVSSGAAPIAFGTQPLIVNGGVIAAKGSSARGLTNGLVVGGDFGLGGQNAATTLSGTVNLGGATRTLTVLSDGTMSGAISNGGLSVNATGGILTLDVANTYAAGTTLTTGTLALGSSSALGSGTLTINGGVVASVGSPRTPSNNIIVGGNFGLGGQAQSITLNGTIDLGGATRTVTLNNSATFGGAVSNGGLTVASSATSRVLTLNATNSYAGNTSVSGGTLKAGVVGAFGSGTVAVASGAVLDLNSLAVSNAITNNGGTILNAGSYAGTQTLLATATYSSLSSASTLNVGSGGKATLNGSIAGTIATLSGGTAELASGGSLTQGSVANAGKFIFSGTTDTILSTAFSGAGSFQKDAASILSLSGSSFFGAGTQITAGGLLVTGSIGGGLVDVSSAASIGGTGRIGGNLNLQSGAYFKFAPGNTLVVTGSATFGGFGVANIDGLSSSTPDGTYTLISGLVNFANVSNVGASNAYSLGGNKSAYLQQGSMELVVVPEPSAVALVAGGLAAVMLAIRRKTKV